MPAPLIQADSLFLHFQVRRSVLAGLRRVPPEVVHAIDGINLALWRGESLGLVGESGSGKSTLARCLAGLYQPSSGHIRLEGQEMKARRTLQQRRRIQMVFQDPYSSLNPRMTVQQVLREVLRVHSIVPPSAVEGRVAELLELVALSKQTRNSYPRNMSGGQRQRVGIARALALEPEVLIADEPVSALDVSVQAGILRLLSDLRSRLGLTILFITHNLAVVRHVCDRVAVMYLGRIVEVADTETLFTAPRHPYTRALLHAAPRLATTVRPPDSALRGEPPSALHLPGGCRFHPRCPIARPVCAEKDPDLISGGGDESHAAACHFAWSPIPSGTALFPDETREPQS